MVTNRAPDGNHEQKPGDDDDSATWFQTGRHRKQLVTDSFLGIWTNEAAALCLSIYPHLFFPFTDHSHSMGGLLAPTGDPVVMTDDVLLPIHRHPIFQILRIYIWLAFVCPWM